MKDLHSTIDLGEVTIWHHLRRLVADTDFEASWAPVNKLDGSLGLESCNGAVNVFRNNIATVEQASGHVFAITRVALHHLVIWLETGHGDLLD